PPALTPGGRRPRPPRARPQMGCGPRRPVGPSAQTLACRHASPRGCLAVFGETQAERLRGALAGYLVTVAQALEHRAETVERGLLEHRLGAACAQRPDAQLEAAWLELDIDAE